MVGQVGAKIGDVSVYRIDGSLVGPIPTTDTKSLSRRQRIARRALMSSADGIIRRLALIDSGVGSEPPNWPRYCLLRCAGGAERHNARCTDET